MALSSPESEYIALSSCIGARVYVGQMFEILYCYMFPINIFEDYYNQFCIKITSILENRISKHIDIKHNFVKNSLIKEQNPLDHISNKNRQADIFAKALNIRKFKYFGYS